MTHYLDSFPDREISIEGVPHLYFGGTAYLGLQTDEEFQNILISNIKKYGTNYGASRKSNVRFSVYQETENYLADIVGSPSCVTLSSGYLAGQLVAQYYNTPAYKMFYTPNTHCAVNPNKIPSYSNYEQLTEDISAQLQSDSKKTPVVLLDSIDFLGDNYPNFKSLKKLPLQECILVVDDSHGIGIIGENGGGVYRILKELNPKKLIVCCSLGKGFAIQAGAILGDTNTINNFKNTAFFGGASPATPAGISTLKDAESIYSTKRQTLHKNINHFVSGLPKQSNLFFMKNHPAFTFSDTALSSKLLNNNIIVSNFNYPNEDSPLMSRIVLSAYHKKEDIDYLLKCILEFYFKF